MKEFIGNVAYEILICSTTQGAAKYGLLEGQRLNSGLKNIYKKTPAIYEEYMPTKKVLSQELQRLYFDVDEFSSIYSVLYGALKSAKIKDNVERVFADWLNAIMDKARWVAFKKMPIKQSHLEFQRQLYSGRLDREALHDPYLPVRFRLHFASVIEYSNKILSEMPEVLQVISKHLTSCEKEFSELVTDDEFMKNAPYSKELYQQICKVFERDTVFGIIPLMTASYPDRYLCGLFADHDKNALYGKAPESSWIDDGIIREIGKAHKHHEQDNEKDIICAMGLALRKYVLRGIDIGNIILRSNVPKGRLYQFVKEALILIEAPSIFSSEQHKMTYLEHIMDYILLQYVLADRKRFTEVSPKQKAVKGASDKTVKALYSENEKLSRDNQSLYKKLEGAGKPYEERLKSYENEVYELKQQIKKLEEEHAPIVIERAETILEEDLDNTISSEERHKMVLDYISNHKVLIWGAREQEAKRIDEAYPGLSFIDSNTQINSFSTKGFDAAVLYTGYTSHPQYYKIKDLLKTNAIPFRALGKSCNNHSYLDQAIYSLSTEVG